MATIKRPSVHLIVVAEPLLAFHQLEMRCGVILKNALMVYGLSLDFRPDVIRPLGEKICPLCKALAGDPPAAEEIPMYEYGLVEKKLWQSWLEARGYLKSKVKFETRGSRRRCLE